jgi:hypothetical protein
LVVGGWWLVVGGWWLVVGGWWLADGYTRSDEPIQNKPLKMFSG